MRAWLFLASIFVPAVAGCSGDDGMPTTPATWQVLAEQRPSSLLGVWASSVDDVWVVGGREGIGMEPSVFHFDGTAWTKLSVGMPDLDLWQVFGFAGGDVFLAGSRGTILRYRDGAFEQIPTPGSDVVFGLWGTGPDDMWAVGGQPAANGFVWRYRGGAAFEAVPGTPAELSMGAVWKVTGRAENDVWLSSSRGLVMHWDGQALTEERIGETGESLFSIGCSADACVTAGANLGTGVLYENTGAGWEKEPGDAPALRGVTPVGDHRYVVGAGGTVIHRTDDGYVSDTPGLTARSLHAAWATDDGSLFTVGGDFDRAPTLQGVVLYKGTRQLPPLP